MSEIKDKARMQMGHLIDEQVGDDGFIGEMNDLLDKILSIPELAVVDREANREFYDPLHQVEVEVPEGWVKEIQP